MPSWIMNDTVEFDHESRDLDLNSGILCLIPYKKVKQKEKSQTKGKKSNLLFDHQTSIRFQMIGG